MIKKIIAIFACVALICVCFTACGDKKKNETSAGSDDVVESSGAGETTGVQGGNNNDNNDNNDSPSAVTEAYDDGRDPFAEDLDSWE